MENEAIFLIREKDIFIQLSPVITDINVMVDYFIFVK